MDEKKFSIGKVSDAVGLPQSVLRYWETVFDAFSPERTPGGTRKFSQKEIDLIVVIKDLLYNQKYTISGANQYLNRRELHNNTIPLSTKNTIEKYSALVQELEELINIIRKES